MHTKTLGEGLVPAGEMTKDETRSGRQAGNGAERGIKGSKSQFSDRGSWGKQHGTEKTEPQHIHLIKRPPLGAKVPSASRPRLRTLLCVSLPHRGQPVSFRGEPSPGEPAASAGTVPGAFHAEGQQGCRCQVLRGQRSAPGTARKGGRFPKVAGAGAVGKAARRAGAFSGPHSHRQTCTAGTTGNQHPTSLFHPLTSCCAPIG